MSQRPMVSVIIPVFRRPDYLGDALSSVLQQAWENIEIIVVDDGSGDEWVARYDLPAGVILKRHRTNRGPGVARNTGAAAASGGIIAWLDSDDVWLPGYLSSQIELLNANADAGLAYTNAIMVDEALRPLPEQPEPIQVRANPLRTIVRSNAVRSPSCVVARRDFVESAGGFDESLRGAEDWDLWIAMSRFGPFACDPTPRVLYRVHEEQRSSFGLHRLEIDQAIRLKWLRWAEREAPDVIPVMRRALCRNLQRHSTLFLQHGNDRVRALRTIFWAIRTYPRDFRCYPCLLRVLAASSARLRPRPAAQP